MKPIGKISIYLKEEVVLKNKFRIEDKELRNISHFPVKALFDMVSDARFIEVMEGVSKGIGFGENYGACVFWNDLDDYDKENISKYEGAEFGLNDGEAIIIGYEDLFYYLTVMCQKYCEEFPSERKKINTILHCYKSRFGIE